MSCPFFLVSQLQHIALTFLNSKLGWNCERNEDFVWLASSDADSRCETLGFLKSQRIFHVLRTFTSSIICVTTFRVFLFRADIKGERRGRKELLNRTRGMLAGNTRERSSSTWGNSQRDYRRRITASLRPDTNWSHATVTGGALQRARARTRAHRHAVSVTGARVRVCGPCACTRIQSGTGATSAQRGNCRLAGPPGALRHHKAYGVGWRCTCIKPSLEHSAPSRARARIRALPCASVASTHHPFAPFRPSALRARPCSLVFRVYASERGTIPGDRNGPSPNNRGQSLAI